MAAANLIFRLIYASRISPACEADVDSVLADILTTAIPRNRARGVTGMLIAHRGWFIHALEADEPAARETLTAIARDWRHSRPHVLAEGPAPSRLFPDWSLCARALSPADAAVLRGFDRVEAFDPAAVPERTLLRLLAVLADAHHQRFSAQQRMMVRR